MAAVLQLQSRQRENKDTTGIVSRFVFINIGSHGIFDLNPRHVLLGSVIPNDGPASLSYIDTRVRGELGNTMLDQYVRTHHRIDPVRPILLTGPVAPPRTDTADRQVFHRETIGLNQKSLAAASLALLGEINDRLVHPLAANRYVCDSRPLVDADRSVA